MKSFEKSIDESIEEGVDFVICSGDLFDTSRPPIETLERAVDKLRELEERGINFYAIEGSHDFSPTDKTMLRVLESAGLLTRVAKRGQSDSDKLRLKFTVDEGTGAKITGVIGRQRALEESYYNNLDREFLEREDGFKIFVFHSAISEYRPQIFQHMKSIPLSLFPKNFDYYAGGHVHKPDVFEEEGYGTIAFPGFTFPHDFRELEMFGNGGFYMVNRENGKMEVERRKLELAEVVSVSIDAEDKTPEEVERSIEEKVLDENLEDKILLYRVEGTMKSGQISDINFNSLSAKFRSEGAKVVKRNANKLSTSAYEEVKVESSSRTDLEERLVNEHAGNHELLDLSVEEREDLTLDLMDALDQEQMEDETKKNYRKRVREDAVESLQIGPLLEEEEE